MSIVNYPTVGQVGSLAGVAHLSNDNTGVLRWAQWEQKSHVEQKGKSSLDFDFQNFQGYNVALKYDTIWISEPYLDSNVPLDDNILSLMAVTLIKKTVLICQEKRCQYVLQGKLWHENC